MNQQLITRLFACATALALNLLLTPAAQAAAPTATTLAASGVTTTNATLNGTVNPGGAVTTAYFQYGLTTNYGSFSATNNLVATNATLAVSNLISSLSPGTVYHYRLVATNSAGTTFGGNLTFTNLIAVPAVFTGAEAGQGLDLQGNFLYAVNVGNNGAPGLVSDAYFTADSASGVTITTPGGPLNTINNWASPNFGASSNGVRLAQAMSSIRYTGVPGIFTVNLAGLQVAVNYQLQLLFIESGSDRVFDVKVNGTTIVPSFRLYDYGPDGTSIVIPYGFTAMGSNALIQLGGGTPAGKDGNPTLSAFTLETLLPGPTAVYTLPATGVTATTATLNGTVNPNGAATTAYFQYGLTTNYGSFSTTNNLVATNATLAVSNLISSLSPGTVYHYRLVATNSAGTTFGGNLTFTNLIAAPAVVTQPATGVTTNSATLNGTVNPGGGVTTAYFQYGLTTNYGSYSATNTLAATNLALAVVTGLSGLAPDTTYHYRIVANNSADTAVGTNVSFKTVRAITPTLSITNPADSGAGSLRQAILDSIPGDSITFDPNLSGYNILLSSGQLLITNNLTIDASSLPSGLTLKGNGAARIFQVASNATVVLTALTLTNGVSTSGGGILNAGSLTLNRCTLAGNLALGSAGGLSGFCGTGGGSGGAATGGGIYNQGTLTLNQCTLTANAARGGNGGNGSAGCILFVGCSDGGNGGSGGNGSGGGIYNAGTLAVNQSTLASNSANGASGGNGGTSGSVGCFNGSPGASGTGSAGGIYQAGGSVTINNTIVAGNTPDNAVGALIATGNNLTNGTPNLLSLGNYGGPTPTMPPLTGSPALNGCTNGTSFSTDQRGTGFPRVVGDYADIGAVEATYLASVATLAASGITATNGTLNGTVNPNGLASTAYFQYGLDTNYGSVTTNYTLPATNALFAVSNFLGNLSPGTVYHYQLVASNSFGVRSGPNQVFTTPPLLPVVTTLPATGITTTTATLNGTVNPGYGVTTAYFQYGLDTNYGSTSATTSLAATNSTVNVTNLIGSLLSGTTYHCRLVATNLAGTGPGADLAFTTGVAVPQPTSLPATGITATSATFEGTVNPGGGSTTAYFQYGPTTNYGSFSATNNLGAMNAALSVSNLTGGLVPLTTYHFRLVANNSAGSSNGLDRVFTTLPLPPEVTTLPATGTTASAATLNGAVNPNGAAATAYFQYGPTTNYGSVSATTSLAATNTALSLSNLIGSLAPATTYHFRLVATNSGGATLGANLTFTTSVTAPSVGGVVTSSNSTAVTILTNGAATPYPSTINLSGQLGFVSKVTVTLQGLNHTYPDDLDILLVGPTGTKVMLMSDCGAGGDITNLNLTLDGDAGSNLPDSSQITAGVYRPTDYAAGETMTAPAPAGPYGTSLSAFNGSSPSGDWKLYVVDDASSDSGSLAQGWSLTIETGGGAPPFTSGITATTATLNGEVNPNGAATTVFFEFGLTTSYGRFSATNALAATNTTLSLSNLITGLSPATTYHFRLVATNGLGVARSSDVVFTTSASTPSINFLTTTNGATNGANGLRTVQLAALVNPNGLLTAVSFQYGVTTSYGVTTNLPSLAASNVGSNLMATIEVSPGFTWHWQLVATNSLGTTTSPDQTFSLGSLGGGGSGVAGDLNGDGVVSQSELDAVYGNYVTNSPWLYITNVAGLGGTNVTFALDNSVSGAYTVQYSTNLVNWLPLGPATPRYLFTDTNAPAVPQRYYRLSYP